MAVTRLVQRFLPVLVMALAASGLPGLCAAQEEPKGLAPGRWAGKTFHWQYNPQGAPDWLSADEAKRRVLTAASRWEACGLKMQFDGDTTIQAGKLDGSNVVGWSRKLPGQMRAVTIGKAEQGVLLERDVVFSSNRLEFQRFPRLMAKVMVHEFGHAIGLRHSPACTDVMTLAASCPPIAPPNLPLLPTANDLAACHALYGD